MNDYFTKVVTHSCKKIMNEQLFLGKIRPFSKKACIVGFGHNLKKVVASLKSTRTHKIVGSPI